MNFKCWFGFHQKVFLEHIRSYKAGLFCDIGLYGCEECGKVSVRQEDLSNAVERAKDNFERILGPDFASPKESVIFKEADGRNIVRLRNAIKKSKGWACRRLVDENLLQVVWRPNTSLSFTINVKDWAVVEVAPYTPGQVEFENEFKKLQFVLGVEELKS